MTRLEKVLQEQNIDNNAMNRGELICFKCPHNFPCIDYFSCESSGARQEYGNYDNCNACWNEEV